MDKFLPRFPNLTAFKCSTVITDTQIEFLASTCPILDNLDLNLGDVEYSSDSDDVSDAGFCAIAKGCRNLSRVFLRDRWRIGDEGVIRLVDGLRNLTCLDLTQYDQVTDQSLAVLGRARLLQSLYLEACTSITDNGLISLVSGPLLNTLKKLVIGGCDRITDQGVTALRLMTSLEELNLEYCGSITDTGGEAISCLTSLKILNLSFTNISDTTLKLLASNCKALEKLVISGCMELTGYGIRRFASHRSLQDLVKVACFWIRQNDVD